MASEVKSSGTNHSGWTSGDGRDYNDDTCRQYQIFVINTYYYVYDYSWSIPAGSTIHGVEIKGNCTDNSFGNTALGIKLCNGTTSKGTRKLVYTPTSSGLTCADAPSYTLGNSTDQWGLSQAEINAVVNSSDFGACIHNTSTSGTVVVWEDGFQITVWYTEPPKYGHNVNETLSANIGKINEILSADIEKVNET